MISKLKNGILQTFSIPKKVTFLHITSWSSYVDIRQNINAKRRKRLTYPQILINKVP